MNKQMITFQSERTNLANWRVTEQQPVTPAAGQILVRVAHFALTANNITYGVAGDSIGYWQFFPAEDGWGCIPVWGFGEVITSAHPDVPVGERIYGYFPMSSHALLEPVKVRASGFVDGASHRDSLPAVYNQYSRTAADPAYDANLEAEQMLYRPLFTTSFFLDDFLEDSDFFGAKLVILTSASSKTSIGLAHLLSRNRREQCVVAGLTSAANKAFVEGLGCYDRVYGYDEVAQMPVEAAVMVDMAGSGKVRQSVHGHFRDSLRYSCAVGATHWDAATIGRGGEDLPGPEPVMFFAPSQIQKRSREWGREEFDARLGRAWKEFLGAAEGWITVERCQGVEELARVYGSFIDGTADPASGFVVSLSADR